MLKNFLKRDYIRFYIRKLRKTINQPEKERLSSLLSEQVLNYIVCKKIKNIALFLSFDGEISTKFLIFKLWYMNINVYLPVLDTNKINNLIFVKYQYNKPLILNKFNIFEPNFNIDHVISINQLDVMFIPIVAFESHGYRLGMGGGFYDRILINWKKNNFIPIGLAYDFQCVKNFPIFHWDVPLPIIITPHKLWIWN